MPLLYYFCTTLIDDEMKLLIVEDEIELLNTITGYLEKEDFVCETAPNFLTPAWITFPTRSCCQWADC